MAMNPSLPDRYSHDPKKSAEENEIQELIYRQFKTAQSEVVMTSININTWRERTVQFIHQYADEQLRILHDDYHRLGTSIQQNLEETLDTVRACREANDSDLFVQLRNECRQSKFQVAQLENVDSKMESPRVVTIEEQKKRHADHLKNDVQAKHSEITVQNRFNERPSIGRELESVHFFNLFLFRGSPTLPFSSKQQPTAKRRADDTPTTPDKLDSNPITTNSEDQAETCHVCFMIYPLNMTHRERCQHVQDHFPDD